jgi:Predicted metal-dependent protease of the PAD1/JAB1 superfamily
MKATINVGLENELVHTVRRRLPFESCGVIMGTVTGEVIEASGFRLIRNAAGRPATQFSFHPEDWIEIFFEAQKNQREIVGLFHSHPSGTIVPSESDLAGFVPWKTYWIVGLTEAGHEIGVYAQEPEARWSRLPLEIVSDGSSRRTAPPASSLADPKSV